MPQKLKSLMINRVALVDAGSNPEADIVLFKRKEETPAPVTEPVVKTTFNEVLEAQKFREVVWDLCSMTYDLETAIASSLYADGDRAAEIKTSVKQFSAAVDAALESWLEGKPVNKRELQELQKRLTERISKLADKEQTEMKIDITKLTDDEKAELRKELGVPEAAPVAKVEPTEEEILKTLPEAARLMIVKAQTTADEAKKEAAEAVAKQKVADEARERVELEKRVNDEFPHLPGTMDEKVIALRAAVNTPHLMTMLKAGNAAAESALLKANGEKPNTTTGGSAYSKLQTLAKALLEKGEVKTIEAGFAKAAQDNGALYAQYKDEQKG